MQRHVEVVVRVRPPNSRERYTTSCVYSDESSVTIIKSDEESRAFQFDKVFSLETTQREIYSECGPELIDGAMCGHNGILFAYGQTGSGKTHTVLGEVTGAHITDQVGIYLRLLSDLLEYKKIRSDEIDMKLSLSAVEVYNDEPRDLLNDRSVLKLHENEHSCNCIDITTRDVLDLSDALLVFKTADSQRSQCKTSMNSTSSRSHALFIVDITQRALKTEGNTTEKTVLRSRICIVDLAGSERIKKSQVVGKAFEEAKFINKSLSSMGKVIHDLNKGSSHVSYRDSKLTRLLKSCFIDPQSRVFLISNISPSMSNYFETVSTLRFADCVKNIKASAQNINVQSVEAYNNKLRIIHELHSELRICKAAYDFICVPGQSISGYQEILKQRQLQQEVDNNAFVRNQRDVIAREAVENFNKQTQIVENRLQKEQSQEPKIKKEIEKEESVHNDHIHSEVSEIDKEGEIQSELKSNLENNKKILTKLQQEHSSCLGSIQKFFDVDKQQQEEDIQEQNKDDLLSNFHQHQQLSHSYIQFLCNNLSDIISVEIQVESVSETHHQIKQDWNQQTNTNKEIENVTTISDLENHIERQLEKYNKLLIEDSEIDVEEISSQISVETISESETDIPESSFNRDEYYDGPSDLLESMINDVERELLELDPTRQHNSPYHDLDSSQEDDSTDTTTTDDEQHQVPDDGIHNCEKQQLRYSQLRGLPNSNETPEDPIEITTETKTKLSHVRGLPV